MNSIVLKRNMMLLIIGLFFNSSLNLILVNFCVQKIKIKLQILKCSFLFE